MARSSTQVAESSPDKDDPKTNTPDDTASPHSEHPRTPLSQPQSQEDDKPVDDSTPRLPDEQPPPLPDEQPPLPDEQPPLADSQPPLPSEAPPSEPIDDGWQPMWDERAQAYYFYNHLTNVSQWENPRVPEETATTTEQEPKPAASGYNPAIHGDYDPNADYAKPNPSTTEVSVEATATVDPAEAYAATGAFNRFTGKWQNADFTPDRFSDESKSNRQMSAFFDVDTAANTHDGRSLKAERANKKISKKELQAFKDKRRERKEEKRRAWLRD